MTFSIVEVDKKAREVGFVIASCNWDARRVCMAQAEVGAIASQASGDQTLLRQYFEKLAEVACPEVILEAFKNTDAAMANRQIGMIALDGHPVAFTGDGCMEWAGHRTGDGFGLSGEHPSLDQRLSTRWQRPLRAWTARCTRGYMQP